MLDIGCGEGTFLLAMKSKDWSVVGVETHPDGPRQLGLTVFNSIEEMIDRSNEEASDEKPFQCVTMWHSLEHFPDPNNAFATIEELIGKGGSALIAVPNYESKQAKLFGRSWLHLDVPRHLTHFTMRSIEALAAKHSMTATRLRHSEFEYDWMGWIQSGLNVIGLPPNLLLKMMMGRKSNHSIVMRLVSLALGCGIGVITLLPTLAGCLLGRGGTLVVQIRPNSESQPYSESQPLTESQT